jgi:hypothetical protein
LVVGNRVAIPNGRRISFDGIDICPVVDGEITSKNSYIDATAWYEGLMFVPVSRHRMRTRSFGGLECVGVEPSCRRVSARYLWSMGFEITGCRKSPDTPPRP